MVSIVILNYNDHQLTTKYAQSISGFLCLDHIVIVDNCSTDNSYLYLQQLKSGKIDVIKTETNAGYASGNNYGIKFIAENYGKDGIVIISNPDIIVNEKTVNDVLDSFAKIPDLFAATAEVYSLDGTRIPLFTWKVPTYLMLLLECSTLLKVLTRKIFKISRRYLDVKKIENAGYYFGEALPGCFFAVDMKKFWELGLFSEKTFLYFEEDILFEKAKKCGYKSVVIKESKLTHAEGVSTHKSISSWKKREHIMERSCEIYLSESLKLGWLPVQIYRLTNYLFLTERFIFYCAKKLYKTIRVKEQEEMN